MTASRETTTTEQLSTRRELELLRDLQRLANERAREEERIRTVLADGLQAAEQARDAAAAEIEREFNEGRTAATSEYESVTGEARQRYEADRNAAQKEYKGLRHGVESELSRVKEAAHNEKQQASWEALTVFDASRASRASGFWRRCKRLKRNNQELAVLEHDAVEIMQMRRQWREFPAVEAVDVTASSRRATTVRRETAKPSGDAVEQAIAASDRSDNGGPRGGRRAASTRNCRGCLKAERRSAFSLLLWVVAAVPCAHLMGRTNWLWIVASFGDRNRGDRRTVCLAAAGCRGQSGRQFQKIQQLLADAQAELAGRVGSGPRAWAARGPGIGRRVATSNSSPPRSACMRWSASARVGAKARSAGPGRRFRSGWPNCEASWTARLAAAKKKHSEALALVTERRDRREAENRKEYTRRVREVRAEHDRDWESLADRWRSGLAELNEAWDRLHAECERLFPDWNVTEYADWPRPTEAAPAIEFGQLSLDLSQIKNGIPQDERLRPAEYGDAACRR